MSGFKRPGWRQDGEHYWTGNDARGAVAWPWLGNGWYRLQVWDRPRTKLITYRRQRSLQQAMVKAEAWLSDCEPATQHTQEEEPRK